jgi:hypothetical protein
MQERGRLEEDSDNEVGVDMMPDNMCQGPVGRAPVHISAAAQRAGDKLHKEARDSLNRDVREFQETVRDHQALVHRDQQAASGGASGGVSRLYNIYTPYGRQLACLCSKSVATKSEHNL